MLGRDEKGSCSVHKKTARKNTWYQEEVMKHLKKASKTMAHKSKDNKAHGSGLSKHTSTPGHKKRPSRERGPFGTNNGTVQPEHVVQEEKESKVK